MRLPLYVPLVWTLEHNLVLLAQAGRKIHRNELNKFPIQFLSDKLSIRLGHQWNAQTFTLTDSTVNILFPLQIQKALTGASSTLQPHTTKLIPDMNSIQASN